MYVSSHAPVNPFNPPSTCSIYQPNKAKLSKYFKIWCNFGGGGGSKNLWFWQNSWKWNFSKQDVMLVNRQPKAIHLANLLTGLILKQTFGGLCNFNLKPALRYRLQFARNISSLRISQLSAVAAPKHKIPSTDSFLTCNQSACQLMHLWGPVCTVYIHL